MKTSERLLHETRRMHEQILAHPFVRGIGSGDLPLEPFKFYIRQDYLFLIEYSRVQALAVAKAYHLDMMGDFADLLRATLRVEMDLHRGYCARFGITAEDLEATEFAPTTYAYTRHLLSVAYEGTIAEIIASMLPCQWGYGDIGRHLAAQGLPASQPLYAEWIEMYSSEEFKALGDQLCQMLDQLTEHAAPEEQARLSRIFKTSTRYEYAFWDMAYRQEQWPV